jgi:hypothetical protein
MEGRRKRDLLLVLGGALVAAVARRMLRFRGAVVALLFALAAIVAVQLWPRPDLAPFVMTITRVDSQRVGFSDGRTLGGTSVYRLEYRDRNNWSVVLISDMIPGWTAAAAGQGAACRDGAYGHITTDGSFTVTDRPVGWCHYAPDRWIGYGIATGMPWDKTIAGNVITYEDYGERVSFDARTGLPIRYEAGLNPNATGHLVVTYTLERP